MSYKDRYKEERIGISSDYKTQTLTDLDIQTTDIVAQKLRESRERERRQRRHSPFLNDLDVHIKVIAEQARQKSHQALSHRSVRPTVQAIAGEVIAHRIPSAPLQNLAQNRVDEAEDPPPSYEECIKSESLTSLDMNKG